MQQEEHNFIFLAGAKQTRRALRDGRAAEVLYALDADPALTGPLVALCQAQGIPAQPVPTMRQLGARCKIATGAAIAAVCRKN